MGEINGHSPAVDPIADSKFAYSDDPRAAKYPIRFCDDHWRDLRVALPDEELCMRAFEVLVRLSLKSIGQIGVCRSGCPVCAFREFDFIGEVAGILQPPKPEIVTL